MTVLLRLLNAVMGWREVRCEEPQALCVLNSIRERRIEIWGLGRCREGGIRFCLLDREYRRAKPLFDAHGMTLVTERRHGLPYLVYRYRRRVGIPLGLFLLLGLTHMSTLYIWDIKVSGNETVSDAAIIASLEKLGCEVGSYIPSIDFYRLCHELILENEEIGWISVNMVGTTAEVKLIERDAKGQTEENNGTPSNLIARFDGEIVRTETASGELYVVAGEQVKKGQLLVGGVLEIGQGEETGRFLLVRSRARIFARTERVFEVVVPFRYTKNVSAGRVIVKKTLKFFGKSMKLQENSSILPEGCDIIVETKRIVLGEGKLSGGIPLPAYLITTYYEETKPVEVNLTEEEALTIAAIEMSALVEEELSEAELLSSDNSWERRMTEDGEVLVLSWRIVCIEDIAEEVPLGVEG